jgi:hypothetical protein
MRFLRKRAKKESETNGCLHTCACIMAAPPFGTNALSGMVSHVSGAFFFVLFSLKKSFVEDRMRRKELTGFSTLKTGLVQPSNCIIFYET